MQTDRTIFNNKPDITIGNKKNTTCVYVNRSFSGDKNSIKKETEKILNINVLLQKYSAFGM
jgi:hypothetical protein